MEGTASANAKARIKLKGRIDISPGRTSRRWLGSLITKGCFRTSARKAENGFVAAENCFVATFATKHWAGNLHDFSTAVAASALSATGGAALGHWPSAAASFRWT